MELWTQSSNSRFSEYVEALATVLRREDRAGPFKDYCTGLLMPGERKSVEPMAAIIAPARVSAKHQSLLHLVGQAAWSDEAVLAKARELVLPAIEAQGKIEAWIVDDTGFAKKGVHSVGVARQYCGRLGKTDNCQIAVTLSIANHAASLPIAYRLYLPEDWAVDEARRKEAGVPDDVTFQTKPEIALAQIRAALAAGVAPGVLLTDAGYGADGAFRSAVTASGLTYVVGVQSTLSVWPPGVEPLPPKPGADEGAAIAYAPRRRAYPCSAKTLARGVPEEAWRIVRWREALTKSCLWVCRRRADRPASREWKFQRLIAGIASHRMARGRKRAAKSGFRPCRRHPFRRSRRHGQIALAHRARLRGSQKRGSASPISKGEAARIHHHAVLCIAAYGFSSANERRFPLRPRHAQCLAYPCVQTQRRRQSDPNDMSKVRSRRSEGNSTIALARTLMRCPCCQPLPSRRSNPGSS